MNYKFTISLLLLCLSASALAETIHVEISAGTTEYLKKNVLSSCSKLPRNKYTTFNYLETYFEYYSNDIKQNGYHPNHSYYENSLNNYLKEYACDQSIVLEFRKKINQDLLPAHLAELDIIKKEIEHFRKKDLSASAQVAKYLSYQADNYLTDLELDPSIAKLSLSLKDSQEERKKTCSDVMNLRDPLSLDKPKEQDTIGWCYAYAASDLVANALGRNPSAVQAAMLVNDKFWYKMFNVKEGGFIDTAIKEMISEGICLEHDLPSGDYNFSQHGYDLNQVFNKVLELSATYKENQKSSQEVMNDLCINNQEFLLELKKVFPELNISELGTILTNGSSNSAFKRIAFQSCKISRDDDLKSLKVKSVSQKEEIFPTLDDQLTKGNILGIHYGVEVLIDNEQRSSYANHASSIVGRRFNPKNNSCEYLLRNSWGKSCSAYPSDYECHNGHVWVGEEFFKYNDAIKEVIYVEKK